MTPPDDWGSFLTQHLGLDLYEMLVVATSAVAMYLVLVLVLRVFGARMMTVSSVSTAVVAIVLGAVAGRAILGTEPTLLAGITALVTLGAMESLFHAVERSQLARDIIGGRPVIVFCNGEPVARACKETGTSEADLRSVMRKAGVADPAEVQCIVLEPQGGYSVVRAGDKLNPDLYRDVEGIWDCVRNEEADPSPTVD